uniref:NADH:ubiquinone reductase (H(+)-translocating) n=1 Tax=Lamellodiscus spari TaxID=330065 RepID=A0A346Q029_9PLAT|nr:NADH dehydrogenase subunit 5 [Lamellodiscus spari]
MSLIFLFLCNTLLFLLDNSISLNINFCNSFNINCGLEILFLDWIGLFMLCVCYFIVLFYSKHYFGGEIDNLNKLILLFVTIMVGLIISNNVLVSLVWWEFLGVSSFFLILWYSNFDTSHAGVVTLVSSRFGDVALFFLVGSFFGGGLNIFLPLLALLVIGSKSASFPLSSWLIEAMRAPTPVSSLVHSSTLVAAGVWFLNNYFSLLNSLSLNVVLLFSLITITISIINLNFYIDLKKLIALSTCNNINWCIVFSILGFSDLAMIQLLVHGISKCLLFCSVGNQLNANLGNQASYNSTLLFSQSSNNIFTINILILIVSGIFFNGIYFSKHILLCILNGNNNFFICVLLYFLVLGSYIYSFRLFFLFFNNSNFGLVSGLNSNFYFCNVLILLGGFSCYYLSSSLNELTVINYNCCLLYILMPFLGGFLGYYSSLINSNIAWNSVLFSGLDLLVTMSYSLINSISNTIY